MPIYINAENAVESATPHELLHANASPDFLQAVGVALNEGITEKLALDALAAGGVRAEKAPAYPKEREVAAAIVKLTGQELVLRAYFNGGQALTDFIDAVGRDTIESIKRAAARGDIAGALSLPRADRLTDFQTRLTEPQEEERFTMHTRRGSLWSQVRPPCSWRPGHAAATTRR